MVASNSLSSRWGGFRYLTNAVENHTAVTCGIKLDDDVTRSRSLHFGTAILAGPQANVLFRKRVKRTVLRCPLLCSLRPLFFVVLGPCSDLRFTTRTTCSPY